MPFRAFTCLFTFLAAGAFIAGCGNTRAEGDPDGIPVTFVVHADRAFFSRMASQRTTVSSGIGVGVGTGGMGTGLGLGIGFHGTSAYLLGGAHPGEAGSFRHALTWGETRFTVPLRSGRTIILTAQAEGGRQGWETVGEFTVGAPGADEIDLKLDADGAHLVTR